MILKYKILAMFLGNMLFPKPVDSIYFKLYMHDQCADTTYVCLLYYFEDLSNKHLYKPESKSGICKVPKMARCKLFYLDTTYPLTYRFINQEADTLNIPKLYFAYPTATDSHQKAHYVFCSDAANGWLADYFKNHKKRVEGRFSKGKLIGKLTYYDLDGKITANHR